MDNAFVDGRVIHLTSPVAGKVEAVNLARFSVTRSGETAFLINHQTAAAKVTSAEDAVRAAFSEAGQVCMQLGSQVEKVKLTDLTINLAKDKADNLQKLFERGFVSKRQVDEQRYEEEKARISSEMERLEQKRLAMDVNRTVPGSAGMTQAIVQLRQALIDQHHSKIKVNHEVFTQEVHVLPGQWVDSGALLATVIPVETMRVQANLIESQINRVWIGQPVSIRIDGMGKDQVVRGHVEAIVPATAATFSAVQRNTADSTWIKVAQRIPILIRIDDPVQAANVHIGQSAEVVFLSSGGAHAAPPAASQAQAQAPQAPPTPAADDEADLEHEVRLRVDKEREKVARRLNLPPFCRLFSLNG
ncbi:HlyD family secretion protein (plasmid) [Massilia forsythiae]|uniref:HlyD family secretion protein n=1 Tax=Massilia forsythiae TaxID=2728020 RepID=A0A7Z2W3E5_9BURK|nr:HlyD family efflux transporter periplasmic adaptor subunit [Massilia forsythiae]QJE03665.1 HlyD family secretion protein [Massilia forsythiae]